MLMQSNKQTNGTSTTSQKQEPSSFKVMYLVSCGVVYGVVICHTINLVCCVLIGCQDPELPNTAHRNMLRRYVLVVMQGS